MPLFCCSKCGRVENTASSLYWVRDRAEPPLCSACDPKIGKWHGLFEKEPADNRYVEGEDGFLYLPSELAPGGYFHGRVKAEGKG